MKLGVLTGGSDAPGLNAVIRAVVRAAVFRYQDDVAGVIHGFEGLLHPPEIMNVAPDDLEGLLRWRGALLGSSNRGSPFRADGVDRSNEVLESLRWLDVDALLCIGGDGSLAIAQRLSRMGVPIVGIPKSVENSIGGTGVSFGFATAVEIATHAIDSLQTTRESFHRVMYLEVIGRQAGWVALYAGVSGGADVVLLPELPYDPDHVANLIQKRKAQGKKCTVVIVSEGAHPRGGEPVAEGAAEAVARTIHQRCPEDYRVTVLGHLQRGGIPTSTDRILATRLGAAAVKAAHDGDFGTMVASRGGVCTLVPLDEVTRSVKTIDLDSELVWTARSLGTNLGTDA